jgi:hypothetical protein
MKHTYSRIALFFSVLWRRYDERVKDRISLRTAWEVTKRYNLE